MLKILKDILQKLKFSNFSYLNIIFHLYIKIYDVKIAFII